MILDEDVIDRFWSNVDIRGFNECWEWKRCRDDKGYGQFGVNRKMTRVHRISWFLENGEIPEFFEDLPSMICHSCDNPPCCNPNHLFLGDNKINQEDCVAKGRHSFPQLKKRGVKHHFARLTEFQVCEIRFLLREGRLFHKEIADRYGVSRRAVGLISAGETWSHVK